jgi:hypothetical protein
MLGVGVMGKVGVGFRFCIAVGLCLCFNKKNMPKQTKNNKINKTQIFFM